MDLEESIIYFIYSSYRRSQLILLGLVFSCGGDALLNINLFPFGMISFGVAHVFYISAFGWQPRKWILGVGLFIPVTLCELIFFLYQYEYIILDIYSFVNLNRALALQLSFTCTSIWMRSSLWAYPSIVFWLPSCCGVLWLVLSPRRSLWRFYALSALRCLSSPMLLSQWQSFCACHCQGLNCWLW